MNKLLLFFAASLMPFAASAQSLVSDLSVQRTVKFGTAASGTLTPSQITSNQNDYSPTGIASASVLRLSTDASRNITGIAPGTSPGGRLLLLSNVGSFAIVLKDESSSSSAANRFALSGDITVSADSSVILQYDSTSSRWRLFGGGGAGDLLSTNNLSDLTSASTARTNLGLAIGTNVQAYDADLTTWAGVTPGTGIATALSVNVGSAGAPVLFNGALGTPSSGTVTNLTGTASININGTVGATTPATGSFTTLTTSGVNTLPGSFIRTPATITITEASPDTGTIDITKGYSQATIDEATTFTPSAAGTSGQFLTIDVTNSGGSAYTMTVDTASDFTFTAAASATTTVVMRSNGSGWFLVGGSPAITDLGTVAFAAGDSFAIWDSSAGTTAKALLPVELIVAISDESTALTTGTAKVTIRAPWAFTVTGVRASLNTVSSSGNPAFDINEGGGSIFSTTLTIDANEKTSTTAATAAVISDTAIADDAELTFDIDTAGTGAKGAKIIIYGTR